MVDFSKAFGPDAAVSVRSLSDRIGKQVAERAKKAAEKIAAMNGNICAVAEMAETVVGQSGTRLRSLYIDDDRYGECLAETLASDDGGNPEMNNILFGTDTDGKFYTVSVRVQKTERDGESIRSTAGVMIMRKDGYFREIVVPDDDGNPCWKLYGEQLLGGDCGRILSEEQMRHVRNRTVTGGAVMAICEGISSAHDISADAVGGIVDDILIRSKMLLELAGNIGSAKMDFGVGGNGLAVYVVGPGDGTVEEADGELVIRSAGGEMTARSAKEAERMIAAAGTGC